MNRIDKRKYSSFLLSCKWLVTTLIPVTLSTLALSGDPDQERLLEIPSQKLETALQSLSKEADLQILFSPSDVETFNSPHIHGSMSSREALSLMFEGTGLQFMIEDSDTIVILLASSREDSARDQDDPATNPIQKKNVHAKSSANTTNGNEIAEITVTGSRIARKDGYSSPMPVTVLNTDELLRKAPTNIPDALNQLPQFQGSISQNEQADTGSSKARSGNYLDLRALGPQRLLILLDGRRVPATSSNGATDTNLIPQMLINRVEVVTGGASAAYGSDAVSGVVNFIIDKEFEGAKIIAQSGISSENDDESYKVGIAGGLSLADDRLHLLGSVERFDSDGIDDRSSRETSSGERSDSALTIGGFGTTENPYRYVEGASLTFASSGGLILNGPLAGMQFLPDGNVGPFNPGIPVPGRPGIATEGDGVVFASRNRTGVPSLVTDQYYGRAEFDLTDSTSLFAQLTYNKGENEDQNFSPFTPFSGTLIFRENAFLLDDVSNMLGTTGSFAVNRILEEWPAAQNSQKSKNFVSTIGLTGTLFHGKYDWSAHYTYGDNEFKSDTYVLQNQRYFAAVDAVFDGAGNIVCNITVTNPGLMDDCVPLNILGVGASTTEAQNYVLGHSIWAVDNNLEAIAGQITGEAFDLWAGPLAIAVGAEYRHQEIEQTSNSNPAIPTDFTGIRGVTDRNLYQAVNVGVGEGSYSVKEVFGEASVPLLSGSVIGDLELDGALRYTDYSTSGSVVTWKVGSSFQPVPSFRVRGTVSRDIRAPSLFELFAGKQQTTSPLTDLHTGVTSFVNVVSSGNTDLDPEEAKTYTFGMVFSPPSIEGLNLSLDYYNIKIDDAIAQPFTYIQMADICEQSNGASELCNQVIRPFPFENRAPENYPSEIRLQNLNISTLETRGIDFEGSYNTLIGPGELSVRFIANRLISYEQQHSPESPVREFAGNADFIQGFFPLPMPKWRWNLDLNYKHGNFSYGVQERYIGSFDKSRQFVYEDNKVSETYYTDFNLTYDMHFSEDSVIKFFLTVNNIFDQKGRLFLISAFPGGNMPVSRNVHDVIGRYFTVGVSVQL